MFFHDYLALVIGSHRPRLEADLKSHQTDRAAAKTAMAEAKNIRAGEASTFAALSAESNANIAAATKATAAVSKGMSFRLLVMEVVLSN